MLRPQPLLSDMFLNSPIIPFQMRRFSELKLVKHGNKFAVLQATIIQAVGIGTKADTDHVRLPERQCRWEILLLDNPTKWSFTWFKARSRKVVLLPIVQL